MNNQKYRIMDWAGNDKTSYYGLFDSFEDAWGTLYAEFDHLNEDDFNDQMSEFYVELNTPQREKRYLDPKDLRAK